MLTLAKRGEGVWLAGFKQIPGLSLVTKPPLFLLLLLIVEARWRTDALTSEAVFFAEYGCGGSLVEGGRTVP